MTQSAIVGVIIGLILGAIGGYALAGKKAPPATSTANTWPAMQKTSANPQTTEEKIQDAMSAAPENIAKDATVLDWPGADGKMAELRKGTNGWTCLPDDPSTPGNDPVCVDNMALQWFGAYMQHKTPKIAQAGIGYMLQGGASASNVDPFATAPKQGESWMQAPPHLMVFPNSKLDANVYGTEMNGGPWIMWAGTPYEHLMVPVQ